MSEEPATGAQAGRNEDEQLLLSKLPKDGSAVGNLSLRKELGWDQERYWRVRNTLLEQEAVMIGRGKGGSVRLTNPSVSDGGGVDELPEEAEAQSKWNSEEALYEPLAKVLEQQWAKDLYLGEYFVEITARQGRRSTGGKWSRPDIVLVSVSVYEHLPGRFLDVTTFEVKPSWEMNVAGVYEALAHRRSTTRSYLAVHVPKSLDDQSQKNLELICEEASRHDVGVVTFEEPDDYSTWDFKVEAGAGATDPSRLNEFIETQLSEQNRKKLRRWVK